MACTPKPERRAIRRRQLEVEASAAASCGYCMCCPCNRVGCDEGPRGGRRKREPIKQYARRWIADVYRYDPFVPGKHKRRAPASSTFSGGTP